MDRTIQPEIQPLKNFHIQTPVRTTLPNGIPLTVINAGEQEVVMKRAVYFITCGGRMMYPTKLEEDYIVRNLTDPKERIRFGSDGMSYRQMTLFDDGVFSTGVRQEEVLPAAVGEL